MSIYKCIVPKEKEKWLEGEKSVQDVNYCIRVDM